jgi:hypothetical protein
MIMPYSAMYWPQIEFERVRRVDPVEESSAIGPAPLRDYADQLLLVTPRKDRVEISGDALRLLAAYEQSHSARNAS